MGIQIEFNPDLALRHIDHYHRRERTLEECIPENLVVGTSYAFLSQYPRRDGRA